MQFAREDMLWCDQPDDANYNRLVRAPFGRRHEEMKRKDGLYDICLVLDWNVTARARNRGSAIFFHLIRPVTSRPSAASPFIRAICRVFCPSCAEALSFVFFDARG
jgi:hypothetical protein